MVNPPNTHTTAIKKLRSPIAAIIGIVIELHLIHYFLKCQIKKVYFSISFFISVWHKGFMKQQIEKQKELLPFLKGEIIGQVSAITELCEMINHGEFNLTTDGKPKGTFLSIGPTGVGKTETVKALSKFLFGTDKFIARFDMSEYMTLNSYETLIGSSQRQDNGFLGSALESEKSKILLFDEMEKAHPDILNLFLQMLDDARITTRDGKTHDLSDKYIFFTSNIGAKELMRLKFSYNTTIEKMAKKLLEKSLRPEFINRFDAIFIFSKLSHDDQRKIGVKLLDKAIKEFSEKNYSLTANSGVLELCLRLGTHPTYGARPLRRAVYSLIRKAVTKDLMEGGDGCGELIADSKNKSLSLKKSLTPMNT